jgi:hypothetical protein
MSFAYMRARLYRGSRTSARCRMHASDRKLATHAMITAVGLAQVAAHGVLFVLTGEFLNANRVRHRLGLARGLGKLTYRRGQVDFIAEKPLQTAGVAG